jgi:hypothetical protein
MTRLVTMMLAAIALTISCTGCMGRMIGEGLGVATGASGKLVTSDLSPDLMRYKGLTVEPIRVTPGLQVPAEMSSLIATDLATVGASRNLMPSGQPALKVTGEIIHYETADMIDTAIGPLSEVIVQAKLIDGSSGKLIGQANLIGRSKATTSGNLKDLAAGVGKAFDKWLKDGGLKKPEKEKNKE